MIQTPAHFFLSTLGQEIILIIGSKHWYQVFGTFSEIAEELLSQEETCRHEALELVVK